MNISFDCTIDLNGLELEVTVEADCHRKERGLGGFPATWGDCTILQVDCEEANILSQLSLVQIAALETQALEYAQTQEDDRGYQG